MTREDLFTYVKAEYGVSPDFPWNEDFESAVLRHIDTRKWFGLAMFVRADKLGYPETEFLSILTLKCEPLLIDALIQKPGYHRAYHMNKTQWMSIELDSVSDDEIKDMLDLSFRLTDKKKKIDYRKAHAYCTNHKPELEKDSVCGCFYCLKIFHPSEIEEWLIDDNPADERGTALCPYCNIDSVIGESSGYPITPEFLEGMYRMWFKAASADIP